MRVKLACRIKSIGVLLREACQLLAAVAVASLITSGSALASTGCTAINGGALNLAFLGGNGQVAVDRNIAAVAFDAGDVITLAIPANSGPNPDNGQNITLTIGAVTQTLTGPSNLAGMTLTITAIGTETTGASHLGTYTSDGPGIITVSCTTAQAAAVQKNKNLVTMMQGGQLSAQASGAAISSAVSSAVAEAFADVCNAFTPLENGMRFNVIGLTDRDPACFDDNNKTKPSSGFASDATDSANAYAARKRSRADDAFSAFEKKPSSSRPQDWRVWIEVRGSNWNTSGAATDLRGDQINVLAGLTRRFTKDVVGGIYGGYESFRFTSDAITGRLKGDGGTIGSYVGWRIADGVRFDAAFGYSQIGYNVSAATMPGVFASGNLTGDRWLAVTGLTGDYVWRAFTFEPSARVYWLTERETSFVDSLGNVQADRTFATGRASFGNKVIFPATAYGTFAVAPYAGSYGDYYFTSDDSNVVLAQNGLAAVSLQGWSGRAIAGLTGKTTSGTQMLVGAEYGGIGGDARVWTYRARIGVPF